MVTVSVYTVIIGMIAIFIRKILFALAKLLCTLVGFLMDVFEMVAGLQTVTYKGSNGMSEQKLLIKVLFGNTNINTIYWGMALIGIVMCIAFTIIAVIKKSADSSDKMKQSMGDILKDCFKGVTLILLMNFIVSATISISSVLMDRIDYLITNAQNIDMSYDVTFDEDDYATMARCLNTIGNYSLNSSYNSRYNLNFCYNDIREDLKHLAEKGKFDVTYISTAYNEDGTTRTINTWQSVLQKIYRSVDDINQPQSLDEYNTKLSEAILEAMSIIKNDASFEALEKYHVVQKSQEVGEMVELDRMIMLLGSMYGEGGNLKKGSDFTDYLRGPYYYGQKNIFDYDTVSSDFDMSVGTWMYLTVILVGTFFLREMLAMVFNAVARIFNMLLLYISAPPFIAVTPLDDGGKLKQWTTAFIIQSFGLIGTVIALRLVMIFIPMIFSGDIQFFKSAQYDIFTRILIMYGALFTARKASGMIVGILADNAGAQAITAGDVGSDARDSLDKGWGYAKELGGMVKGLADKGLSKADEAVKEHKGAAGNTMDEFKKYPGGGGKVVEGSAPSSGGGGGGDDEEDDQDGEGGGGSTPESKNDAGDDDDDNKDSSDSSGGSTPGSQGGAGGGSQAPGNQGGGGSSDDDDDGDSNRPLPSSLK